MQGPGGQAPLSGHLGKGLLATRERHLQRCRASLEGRSQGLPAPPTSSASPAVSVAAQTNRQHPVMMLALPVGGQDKLSRLWH